MDSDTLTGNATYLIWEKEIHVYYMLQASSTLSMPVVEIVYV